MKATERPVIEEAPPFFRAKGIGKAFPGVQALRGVDLELSAGEVLALVGENGAGKSTLIKILSAAHSPDAGTLELDGRPVEFHSPSDAIRHGVAVIYQEFNLIPSLTAVENIFLGQEPNRCGWIRRREELRRARELMARTGLAVDLNVPCRQLSVAQQQVVEIVKALSLNARLLVMDEPSATLTDTEVRRLFGVIRELQSQGIGVIYISHRLEEVFEIANRVVVMRDGAVVLNRGVAGLTRRALIETMVGRKMENEFPGRKVSIGKTRLRVVDLNRPPMVRNVSFEIRAGEVLGLAGLVGSGRTEMARALFGADARTSGEVRLDGTPIRIRHPRDAIRAGIGFLTEDRKSQGLILNQPVRDNFSLPSLKQFSRWNWISFGREAEAFERYRTGLNIKTPHPLQRAAFLSGGNQQKVVLAKWLRRQCEVLIFDEPTRGVDIGAKYEIYKLINELAAGGKAILLISSELPEIIGMCDRALVMREGRIAGEIEDASKAAQEDILALAMKE